jgi:hypothetical protein
MSTIEQQQLVQRSRQRSAVLWTALDWGGIMEPLTAEQTGLLLLNQATGENFLALSDDRWDLKESQRDRSFELDQAEISQDRRLADEKVALGSAQLAIKQATDDYVLAVRLYDSKAKALLQAAREYAAQVELEQLGVERDRAELAVEKEALHLQEINARIYFEAIQRAQVEAEIARNQLEVAKAHIRVIMSGIEAGKAEVALIEAEVKEAEVLADKATLQADVAMIFAEIITKKLSSIRLDVGQKEIAQGFAIIQSKLADMQQFWDTRLLVEQIKEEGEKQVLDELNQNLTAEKAQEDLRFQETEKDREVFDYDVQQTDDKLGDEKELRAKLVNARWNLANARMNYTLAEKNEGTWAETLVNAARRWTYTHMQRNSSTVSINKEVIGP